MSKSFWFILISVCCVSDLVAQKGFIPTFHTGFMYHEAQVKSITDTITEHFDSAVATLYAAPTGGFASGNSGYNELAKVQEFDVDTSYTIEGVLFWFAYKNQQSASTDSSSVDFVFYNMDSSAVINGIGRFVPHTILQSKKVLIADIDTSQYFATGVNVWTFPSFIVYHNYAVGIRFDHLHIKDTLALFSSTDGDPPIPSLSWEYWQGSWNTLLNNWGLDVDLAVFPLVDMSNLSFHEAPFVHGLKLHVYPNPASSFLYVETELEKPASTGMVLYDMQGRIVRNFPEIYLSSGIHTHILSIEGLPAGTYCFTQYINGGSGIGKLIIIE